MATQVESVPSDQANRLTVDGALHPEYAQTYITLTSGQVLVVPTAVLLNASQATPSYAETLQERAPEQADEQQIVIPVLEERLTIGKRTVDREKVLVRKSVEERVEQQEVSLAEVAWQVERVPIGRVVDQRPGIRQEGETAIYPVIEEQLIVTKQLLLKEEIRITRQLTSTAQTVSEVVRRERVEVERLPLVAPAIS